MTGKMEDYNYKFMLVTEPEDWKMISKEIKEQFYRKVHIYKWKKEQDLEKYIQEIRPDAIILSFSCITANYIAAVKRIREINPQISICTCTAFYSQELIG